MPQDSHSYIKERQEHWHKIAQHYAKSRNEAEINGDWRTADMDGIRVDFAYRFLADLKKMEQHVSG